MTSICNLSPTIRPAVDKTVREIALEQPSSIRVFEYFGIDYCCGGRQPLTQACASRNIPVEAVLGALAAVQAIFQPGPVSTAKDWTKAPLSDLAKHIATTHHVYVQRELPRLAVLAQKVVSRHGDTQPELPMIQELLRSLDAELTPHLAKEEAILFPYIEQLERPDAPGTAPQACFASVASPIAVMCAEHEAAGALLLQIRHLSRAFTTPPGACPTYLAYYAGLHEFEQDLHQHIHLENNILFPRAIALEGSLSEQLAS